MGLPSLVRFITALLDGKAPISDGCSHFFGFKRNIMFIDTVLVRSSK